jgi:hypothetical protein
MEIAEVICQMLRFKSVEKRIASRSLHNFLRPLSLIAMLSVAWLAQADDKITASSSQTDFPASGAHDGDRFSADTTRAWKGEPGKTNWEWQIEFDHPARLGAILMIQGDHEFVARNAASDYVWQVADGEVWHDLPGTQMKDDRRAYRIFRLPRQVQASRVRLKIGGVRGEYPTLREVEFYSERSAAIAFPNWAVVVNTTHDSHLPNEGQQFVPLAKSTPTGKEMVYQQIWLDAFNPDFIEIEPRPLCAFLSGNFKDWCQVDRSLWHGTEATLNQGRLPIWASCGGAQGLAILAETGTSKPWDCPHCRDPRDPKSPIYTHIGHTASKACGDYSGCVFESGPHKIKQIGNDPVFRGLDDEFFAMESHCGQIDHAPKGWHLIATAGEGTSTKTQCLRRDDAPIYAAQFHIEMPGASESSRRIMENFLSGVLSAKK